jgi:hypothetical protein
MPIKGRADLRGAAAKPGERVTALSREATRRPEASLAMPIKGRADLRGAAAKPGKRVTAL